MLFLSKFVLKKTYSKISLMSRRTYTERNGIVHLFGSFPFYMGAYFVIFHSALQCGLPFQLGAL